MLLEMIVIITVALLCMYVGLALYAFLFTNKILYPAPPSSYQDNEGILKLETTSGLSITANHIEKPGAEYTVLYCHGNAEDLGTAKTNYTLLGIKGGYNVLAFDYPGYGTSEGKPDEAKLIETVEAAYKYLTTEKRIPGNRIIIYGRSLGGGPGTDLASRKPVGGLILEATFTSVHRVATRIGILPWSYFDNLGKIQSIQCPVLIMHGGGDHVIPFHHGKTLFARALEPKLSLWVDYAGHGDPFLQAAGNAYWKKLDQFQKLVETHQAESSDS